MGAKRFFSPQVRFVSVGSSFAPIPPLCLPEFSSCCLFESGGGTVEGAEGGGTEQIRGSGREISGRTVRCSVHGLRKRVQSPCATECGTLLS